MSSNEQSHFNGAPSQAENSEVSTQRPPPATSVPTDLRVNTTALNAVALSSVAKYWVLTNLLPGPIPQVSVYGLPTSGRGDNQNKITQVGTRSWTWLPRKIAECIVTNAI
ncbi:uncharacterized protein LOC116178928 [Photinus pyralis]|uniref:uncharacterized protein LOC116178928 n=1 Tax=Photinus pyralis TaxID=7054 RepID=UPI0012676E52|nr:uncharacterized protein LOC116178928 [Photinus pyralis]